MKKRLIKGVAVIMAFAVMSMSFAACSKKSSDDDDSVVDAVDEIAEANDAEEVEFEDVTEYFKGIQVSDLEDGLIISFDADDLASLNLSSYVDKYLGDYASMLGDLSFDDVKSGRIYLRGYADKDDITSLGAAACICIQFTDDDVATDKFETIFGYLNFLSLLGIDMSKFSEDECFFDEDEGEGALILNISLGDVLETLLDSTFVDSSMIEKVVGFDVEDLGRVVCALELHDDTIIFSIALGEEYITEVDSIYESVGMNKPSEVRTSDEVIKMFIELIKDQVMEYVKG